ncbi:mitochondrial carrier protein [Mycena olivaceomarginata]|nr:mitochondrial carrier protein [Mycena olivaceomarginata]
MSAPTPSESRHWDARFLGPVPHDTSYYSKAFVAGSFACGLTHAGMTPVDVAKCNMQVDPVKYRGTLSGIRTLVAEEGSRGVLKGFGPTLVGYSLQGMFKYGFYEVFKDAYMNLAGEELSNKYKPLIWAAGSASAEVIADVALSDERDARGHAVSLWFPGSLWSRQVPYTIAKFCIFEQTVQLFYTYLLTEPKDSYSKPTQLAVTFGSGYIAGIISAIVSNPADSIISQLGKAENKGKSVGKIISEVGFATLATKGLGTRIFMLGTLTGFQWWIYDSCKTAMGMGTTGGK